MSATGGANAWLEEQAARPRRNSGEPIATAGCEPLPLLSQTPGFAGLLTGGAPPRAGEGATLPAPLRRHSGRP